MSDSYPIIIPDMPVIEQGPSQRPYLVYVLATGEITSKVGEATPANWHAQAGEGEGILEANADRNRFYVKNGKLVPRPAPAFDRTEIVADGKDAAVCKAPKGTRVHVKRPEQRLNDTGWNEYFQGETDGKPVRVLAIEPGAYDVHLVPPFPWQVLDVRIEAVLTGKEFE